MSMFSVEVLCPEISEVLQKLAFAAGYDWPNHGTNIIDVDKKYLYFATESKRITHGMNEDYWQREEMHTNISIKECFTQLKKPIPIRVNGHEVVANSGSLKIGCITLQPETVEKLYQMSKDSLK